jgi:HlyD family secretion protein
MAAITSRKWLPIIGVIAVVASAVWMAWRQRERAEIPAAFAAGKGRVKANEYDIVAKRIGRIERVLVAVGDLVETGQAVARIDTNELDEELGRLEVELKQSRDGKQQALATVARRESDIEQALAAIPQRESDVSAAKTKAERSETLLQKQYIAKQEFERDQSRKQTAEASLAYEVARKQVAEAALKAAQIQILQRDAAIMAAQRKIHEINTEIADSVLTAPIRGRIWHRHVESGAVLAAGERVMTLLALDDISMTISLPTFQAGRVTVGSEARIVFDAAPEHVIPATVSSVASEFDNSFEKQIAGEKPASQIKIKIEPELLKDYLMKVKANLNGVAHVRLDPDAPWPDSLRLKIAR